MNMNADNAVDILNNIPPETWERIMQAANGVVNNHPINNQHLNNPLNNNQHLNNPLNNNQPQIVPVLNPHLNMPQIIPLQLVEGNLNNNIPNLNNTRNYDKYHYLNNFRQSITLKPDRRSAYSLIGLDRVEMYDQIKKVIIHFSDRGRNIDDLDIDDFVRCCLLLRPRMYSWEVAQLAELVMKPQDFEEYLPADFAGEYSLVSEDKIIKVSQKILEYLSPMLTSLANISPNKLVNLQCTGNELTFLVSASIYKISQHNIELLLPHNLNRMLVLADKYGFVEFINSMQKCIHTLYSESIGKYRSYMTYAYIIIKFRLNKCYDLLAQIYKDNTLLRGNLYNLIIELGNEKIYLDPELLSKLILHEPKIDTSDKLGMFSHCNHLDLVGDDAMKHLLTFCDKYTDYKNFDVPNTETVAARPLMPNFNYGGWEDVL